MTYVHGHPRDDGWVVGHVRRPNRAEGEQLPLLAVEITDDEPAGDAAPAVPAPRSSPEHGDRVSGATRRRPTPPDPSPAVP
jgi:hypothetical protein